MFESVDTHTDTHTDGQTPARLVYYKLTLRAENITIIQNSKFMNHFIGKLPFVVHDLFMKMFMN